MNTSLPSRLLKEVVLSKPKVISVVKGIGSFVTLSVAAEETDLFSNKPEQIWVYLCDWLIHYEGEVILTSNNIDDDLCIKALNRIKGSSIVCFSEHDKKITIKFNDGIIWTLIPNREIYEEDDDIFILYFQDKSTLSYSLEKGFYFEAQ